MKLSDKRRQNIYWTVGGNYQRRYHGKGNGFAAAEQAMIDRAFPKNRLTNFVAKNADKQSNGKDMRACESDGRRIASRFLRRDPSYFETPEL